MTGVIFGIKAIEEFCIAFQRIIKRQLRKAEASHKNIGLKPFCNVKNTLVGASADEYSSAVFLNKQKLLMTEIIGNKLIIYQHIESKAAKLCIFRTVIAGIKCESLSNFIKIVCENDTLIILQ